MTAANKAEELKGRAKEAAGSLTDDDQLKAEGRTDQQSSSLKQTIDDAAGKAKDAVQSVKEKVTGN